jgi:hypothetical protein
VLTKTSESKINALALAKGIHSFSFLYKNICLFSERIKKVIDLFGDFVRTVITLTAMSCWWNL